MLETEGAPGEPTPAVNGSLESTNGISKKDIGRVVGLHHPVLQTGFDEEGGAIKVPHAADRRRKRREMQTHQHCCPAAILIQ